MIPLHIILPARHSPSWCRFYLSGAAWFKKGVFLHIEERSNKAMVSSSFVFGWLVK